MEENISKQYPEVFIKSISFNDGNTFEFNKSDIVVFTGANNVGKSQVLRDIIQQIQTGDKKHTLIVNSMESVFEGNIEYFIENTKQDNNGNYWTGNSFQHENSIRSWWDSKQLLHGLSETFVKFLNTEQRLISSNPSTQFNRRLETPIHPIQKLYADDEKEQYISKFFHEAFGKYLIVDKCGGNNIPLIVGDDSVFNTGEDRVSKKYLDKLDTFPVLHEQGDGMRSFTSILLDTFTSQHSITLIDEPEAFLHPPQARLLGKMLAKNTPNNRQLFISTHSEDFLKGLLDADNVKVKIIRINRKDNINYMNILSNEDIKYFWKDPILRYSNILSGLFHSKVIVCESDTDCRFYQAVMNSLHDDKNEISPDILFTHCGGKQRLKTVIDALKSLNVKVISIADIDVLNDKDIFKGITDSLGIEWENIIEKWKIIDTYVKQQRAQLDTEEVKKKIQKILDSVSVNLFPVEESEKIKKILKQSTAWSKIKEVGKSFLNGKSYKNFNEIDNLCSEHGLFIVPVGELESFYKPNSNHGTKWVNDILKNVDLKTDRDMQDARNFVTRIIEF